MPRRKAKNNFLNSTMNMAPIDIAAIAAAANAPRPKGAPRAVYNAAKSAAKGGRKGKAGGKRFLDFQFQTTQVNSGTQQYGAGQTMKSRSIGSSATVCFPPVGTKSETLLEYTGSTAYSAERRFLNPGLLTTVVANFSRNFQKWRFSRLVVRWNPAVSGFADAGKAGTILIGYRADPSDNTPVNLAEAQNSDYKAYDVASKPFELELMGPRSTALYDVQSLEDGWKLCRYGRNPANTSIVDYDPGFLFICSEGVLQTTPPSPAGFWTLEYSIEFKDIIDEPILPSPYTTSCCSGVFVSPGSWATGVAMNSWINVNMYNNGAPDREFAVINDFSGAKYLALPPGRYEVTLVKQSQYSGVPTGAYLSYLAINYGGVGLATLPPSNLSITSASYNAVAASSWAASYETHVFTFLWEVADETSQTTMIAPVVSTQFATAGYSNANVAFIIRTCL